MKNAGGEFTTPDERGGSSSSGAPSLLAKPRRRRALERLLIHDEPVELSDLADEVAAAERGATVGETLTEDAKLVYLDLYHSHVPKLAKAGVVEYDRVLDVVEPTDDTGSAASCPNGD